MAALNALAPTIEPMATEHIEDMIALTERLIADGHAYEADGTCCSRSSPCPPMVSSVGESLRT